MLSPVFQNPFEKFQIPHPWQKEDIEKIINTCKLEVFGSYGGSILNPFGTNPEYPFCQIFITQPHDFPEPLLWYFWCLCHQYHILMEFQNLFFNQPLTLNLQIFCNDSNSYLFGIIYFQQIQIILSSISINQIIYQEIKSKLFQVQLSIGNFFNPILDLDEEYEEVQRYIFQQNQCIPQKI